MIFLDALLSPLNWKTRTQIAVCLNPHFNQVWYTKPKSGRGLIRSHPGQGHLIIFPTKCSNVWKGSIECADDWVSLSVTSSAWIILPSNAFSTCLALSLYFCSCKFSLRVTFFSVSHIWSEDMPYHSLLWSQWCPWTLECLLHRT